MERTYEPGERAYHHSAETYENKLAAAAPVVKEKLDNMVGRARAESAAVVEKLLHEAEVRRDFLLPGEELDWGWEDGNVVVTHDRIAAATQRPHLIATDWARGQLWQRLRVPAAFMDGLVAEARETFDDGQPKPVAVLARGTMHDLLDNLKYRWDDKRVLLREVDGAVRGLLSDSYQPVDQSALVNGFVSACEEIAARDAVEVLPLSGSYITDKAYGLRALRGEIIEPLPNEPMVLGIQLSSSEYGCGSTEVRLTLTRMWCTNTAIGESVLRKVHLDAGLRESSGGLIEFSERTLRLNSAAVVSGMKDSIASVLCAAGRDRVMKHIREAAETKVDAKSLAEGAARRGVLRKSDVERVVEIVRNEDRFDVLPNTTNRESRLRYANALSWLAQQKPADERLALEAESGRVLVG